jgi:hypothetical protein
MDRKTPIGLHGEPAQADGIAPYSSSSVPGPLGRSGQGADSWLPDSGRKPAHTVHTKTVAFSFTLGYYTYKVRHLDSWSQSFDELPLRPHQAAAILEQAIGENQGDVDLVRRLETARAELAGLQVNGTLLLLRVVPHRDRPMAAPPEPAPRPARVPAPAPPPSLEPSIIDDQAEALKNAAAAGVPFCEECAKAAAAAD